MNATAKLLTAKHGQGTTVNNLPYGRGQMAIFPTGFGKSMIFTVFHLSRIVVNKNQYCAVPKNIYTPPTEGIGIS